MNDGMVAACDSVTYPSLSLNVDIFTTIERLSSSGRSHTPEPENRRKQSSAIDPILWTTLTEIPSNLKNWQTDLSYAATTGHTRLKVLGCQVISAAGSAFHVAFRAATRAPRAGLSHGSGYQTTGVTDDLHRSFRDDRNRLNTHTAAVNVNCGCFPAMLRAITGSCHSGMI